MLTAERLRQLLHYNPETGEFTWLVKRGCRAAGAKPKCKAKGYYVIRVDKKLYKANRLAWLYMTGAWPSRHIDHADNDPSNDAFINLRLATGGQNMANMKRPVTNTSGLKGVSWNKRAKQWQSKITKNYKQIHLGWFKCPAAAHFAYIVAADKLHGEYARSN